MRGDAFPLAEGRLFQGHEAFIRDKIPDRASDEAARQKRRNDQSNPEFEGVRRHDQASSRLTTSPGSVAEPTL